MNVPHEKPSVDHPDLWPWRSTRSDQAAQDARAAAHTPEGGRAEAVTIAATDAVTNGSNAYTEIKPHMDALMEMPVWGAFWSDILTHQTISVAPEAATGMRTTSLAYPIPDTLFERGSEGAKGGVNHGLLTHNPDEYDGATLPETRSVNRILSEDLVNQFPANNPNHWPQLILTANHALTRGTNDLADIMEGINILAADCMEKDPTQRPTTPIKKTDHPIQTVMACAAERNAFENGAALIDRYNHLKDHARLADRVILNPYDGEHQAPSPAAVRLGKLMLKLMVENPATIDLDDPRSLSRIQKEKGAAFDPPVLREDAAEIAKHITLIGYSKGANTVSDAARWLMGELALTGNGKTVAEKDNNAQTFVKKRSADGDRISLRQEDVARILRGIGNIGLGGGEVPITEEEHALGFRRVRINNVNDLISQAFIQASGRGAEDQGEVEGNTHHMGHAPDDALGTRRQCGYIAKDAKEANKVACVISGKFGKPSLIALGMGKSQQPTKTIHFRFGPSTTEPLQKEAEKIIQEAFSQAGIEGTFEHTKAGEFLLRSKEEVFSPEQLDTMARALHGLGDDHRQMMVALGVYDHLAAKAQELPYEGEDRFLPTAQRGRAL